MNSAGKSRRRQPRPPYLDLNSQIIFGVTLSAVMAVSSITPAFPDIAREPDESAESVGLLITAFTLPGVFLGLEESGDETEALVKTDIIRINDKIPVDYLLTWSDKRFLI